MSDFCFEEEACHVNIAIGEGDLVVFRVWSIVNCGCSAANRIEPFLYPIAYVLQSEDGAKAVIGSCIVLEDMCSLEEGSKRITSPFSLPAKVSRQMHTRIGDRTKCDVAIAHPRSNKQWFE